MAIRSGVEVVVGGGEGVRVWVCGEGGGRGGGGWGVPGRLPPVGFAPHYGAASVQASVRASVQAL